MGGYDKQLEQTVASATKAELTLMLYEGALNFCSEAGRLTESGYHTEAERFILKVQNIIRELQNTLDHNFEISKNFNSLYDYMYRRLVEAKISRDINVFNEICDILRDFTDMWKELIAAEAAERI